MLEESDSQSISEFLKTKFSRVTGPISQKLCKDSSISARANTHKLSRRRREAVRRDSENQDRATGD